jgi:DNA-binding NarL/FixJ family response regulator
MDATHSSSGSWSGSLEREKLAVDVFRGIALGHTNAEVAAQLHVCVRTVESHRARTVHKLRLSTRAELVRYAPRPRPARALRLVHRGR